MYLNLGRIDWAGYSIAITYISAGSVLIPLIAGLVRFKVLTSYLKILLILLGVYFVIEVWLTLLASSGDNNVFLIPVIAIVELTIIIILYHKVFSDSIWKKLIIFIPVPFAIFAVLNVIIGDGAVNLGSYIRSVEALLVIGITLVWFYQALNDASIKVIHREPMFWVSAGFLIYFAGTFFLFITSTYLLENARGILVVAYLINSIANICKNLLFTVALWMRPQT